MKRHYDHFHSNLNEIQGIERENLFTEKKKSVLEKTKIWRSKIKGEENGKGLKTTFFRPIKFFFVLQY